MLVAFLMITFLTACATPDATPDTGDTPDTGTKQNIVPTCEVYENCAVFTFEDFPAGASASFELTRTGLDEGTVYYEVKLDTGALNIKYKCAGIEDDSMPHPLGDFAVTGKSIATIDVGGEVDGDMITVIFEASETVSGQVVIAFTEEARKEHHIHTSSLTGYKYEHYIRCTCICYSRLVREEHIDNDGDKHCDVCDYWMNYDSTVLLSEYETWLTELTVDDIAEIKYTFEYFGVGPGRLKNIIRATDKDVVADILTRYLTTTVRSIPYEESAVVGGSGFTIEFILTDGTVKKIRINNDYYSYGDGDWESRLYFEVNSAPTLAGYENVSKSHAFTTLSKTGNVYSLSEGSEECQLICTIQDVGAEIEFIKIEKPSDDAVAYVYIDCSAGKLMFISDTVFYRKGEPDVYYQLVRDTLSELIAKYSTEV